MKTALIVLTIAALSACTTYEQDAARACGGDRSCISRYMSNAMLQSNAEWETVGGMLSAGSRRLTTCMNIGGIVTCQ